MTRNNRFINYAYTASYETPPKCTFPIGAAVALGSRLISTGMCTTKTHPENPKINTKKTQLCAEVLAAIRARKIVGSERLKDCTLYVTRRRADGSMGLALPCEYCRAFLKKMGIKRIFYTNQAGEIKETRN
jgi:tRNA(Arg) A34 adenosine deaminase TadA